MKKLKTAKIVLDSIKDPDGWGQLIYELDLTGKAAREHFEFSEYASLELVIDESLKVVSGRILKVGK